MDWLIALLNGHSIAHTILIYSFVIALGVLLGKIKLGTISLGVTFVLFIGIAVGHFGFSVDEPLLNFLKEFGLILFIFSIGLQVGPGFFSSFKKDGLILNALALGIVLLGILTTLVVHYGFHVSLPMSVGVMSGAVTNTPGLGAAQEALKQLYESGQISEIPPIALGYAVAYPLGVIGSLLALLAVRLIFKIKIDKETEAAEATQADAAARPHHHSIQLTNTALIGKSVHEVKQLLGRNVVLSRVKRGDVTIIPDDKFTCAENDIIRLVCVDPDLEAVKAFIGQEIEWHLSEEVDKQQLVSRRIAVTQASINGKRIRDLQFRSTFGVNITRVNRAGVDLLGRPDLVLQVGDRVMVVGEEDSIKKVEALLGNTLKRLNQPHLVTIFFGIMIGVLVGSIPFYIGDMPMPAKLGLAGGPLIVSILLGRFGYKLKLVTYTTQSANLMLREIGICLFLASVGIAAGDKFIDTVIHGDGLLWIGCGFLITFIPLIIIGIIGRWACKLNYHTLTGMMAGATTDPPVLAYASSLTSSDQPAVSYSTVYPLAMFMRIICAQLLILFLM